MPAPISRDLDVRRSHARDASGLELVPEGVARPSSVEEVVELLRDAGESGGTLTAAGSQTSTTGASITDRGLILSLRAMDRILDLDPAGRLVRVQPGVTVAEVDRAAAQHGLRFAPDPTSEHDATIGGAIACNASGARSLRYGATRGHVQAVTVALANGEVTRFARPRLEKNAVGYPAAQDPVDWFVGSEGTLGVIVEAELSLVARPARTMGLAVPFPSEARALEFIVAARERTDDPVSPMAAQCLELFDPPTFAIAREAAADPAWGAADHALVYLELTGDTDDDIEAGLGHWLALATAHGANEADVRAYDGEAALREARRLRHAIPARMNELGSARMAAGGRKVSTDWAVPYRRLAETIAHSYAASDRAGIERPVTFGHAGNGHPHQNFIARDPDHLRRINEVVAETVHFVLSIGGTVSAEHGLGKIKRHWLGVQLTPPQVDVMRAIKRALDPRGVLAPGNLF
jgi:glycolate oxidase